MELSLPRGKAWSCQGSDVYGPRRLPTLGKAALEKNCILVDVFQATVSSHLKPDHTFELLSFMDQQISNH